MSPSETSDPVLPTSIGYLLYRARKLSLAQAERAVVDDEIGLTQHFALLHLRDGLADTSGGIARALDHDSGATTRMLDQLEERGLVTRRRSDRDRRVIHLALTPAGHALANRMALRLHGLWDDLLDPFAPSDRAALTSLLQRLVARLESRTAGCDS